MRLASYLLLLPLALPGEIAAADQPPSSLLRRIYRDHQPWVHKEIGLSDPASAGQYFTDSLVELFVKDDKCKERTGEICCINFDPIYDAQDYDDEGIRNFRVRRIRRSGSISYEVSFEGRSLPWSTRLVYSVTRTKKGWRVDDIEYKGRYSLRKALSCDLE